MSVRFVLGRAGTGKTRYCLTHIVDAIQSDPLGPTIYWVVPKQATFSYQRLLAAALERRGFVRARIVSLDQLGEDILAECGGRAALSLTGTGRQIVVAHLLRTHREQLRFFSSVATRPGLAAEINSTFGELERAGQSVETLESLISDLQHSGNVDLPAPASMLAKLHDLHLLYRAYQTFIGQERLDPHRRMQAVLDSIERCVSLASAELYIDGIHEFSEFERQVIARLTKSARATHITYLFDPDSPLAKNPLLNPREGSIFRRAERGYRRLHAAISAEGATLSQPILLRETERFQSAALAGIEKHLFDRSSPRLAADDDVRFVVAPDVRSEVDAAARKIRQLTSAGYRLRDIAVLTRSLNDYHDTLAASFREHGIAFFADRRRTAIHHPLPQLVRATLLIALHQWPNDAIRSILRGGLLPISLDEADQLDNYIIEHRIRGHAWSDDKPWAFESRRLTRREDEQASAPDEITEPISDQIDTIRRRVVDPFLPFVSFVASGEVHPIRDLLTQLNDLLERLGVRQKMAVWMKESFEQKDFEKHDEDQQVWSEFTDLFDQMAEIVGEEKVSAEDFLAMMDSAFASFDLAITPPALDQLLVGDVERTRPIGAKVVFVLGLGESVFPAIPSEKSILSDSERAALADRDIDLEPDTREQLLHERLLCYLAMTRASEKLIVSRSESNAGGQEIGASVFYRRLWELFPGAPEHRAGVWHSLPMDQIGTPRQLVAAVARWARAPVATDPIGGVYPALLAHLPSDDRLSRIARQAFPGISYANSPTLSATSAAGLFPSPLRGSVSQIESFAACPFKHFASYALRLQERDDEEVTHLDLGNVYHGILERIVRELTRGSLNWNDLPQQLARSLTDRFTNEVGTEIRGELLLSSSRNKYLLARIESRVEEMIRAHAAAATKGAFRPLAAEVSFGLSNSALPPLVLTTPRGHQVELRGKIDRVDLADNRMASVIDYKLSGRRLEFERVYHGLALQLLTYLLVLESSGDKLAGQPLTPVAAFYTQLLTTLDSVNHPDERDDSDSEEFLLRLVPRGLLEDSALSLFDDTVTAGASKVVSVKLKQDGTIGYRATSDAVTADEFRLLLCHVRDTLAALADTIIVGDIAVKPFLLGGQSACTSCAYLAVCRFDRSTNSYHVIDKLKKDDVLARLAADSRPSDGEEEPS